MSLLLNMLCRLAITFLSRGKHLLISWLQSPSAVILEPQNIKSATVSTERGIVDHLTCLLRNLCAGQEAIVTALYRTTDWFRIEKGVWQGCLLSSCLFNLYAEYFMRNTGLEEAQAGIKTAGRNINNLRYADDVTLMAESEEELKSLLMKSEGGEWKSWLKTQHSENEDHGIWSHHFMANKCGNSGWLYILGLWNHCKW